MKQFTGKHSKLSCFISHKKFISYKKQNNFQRNCLFSFSFKSLQLFESNVLSHSFLYFRFTSRAFTSLIMPVGNTGKSGPEYWPIIACVIYLQAPLGTQVEYKWHMSSRTFLNVSWTIWCNMTKFIMTTYGFYTTAVQSHPSPSTLPPPELLLTIITPRQRAVSLSRSGIVEENEQASEREIACRLETWRTTQVVSAPVRLFISHAIPERKERVLVAYITPG